MISYVIASWLFLSGLSHANQNSPLEPKQNLCWIDPMYEDPKSVFDPHILHKIRTADEIPDVLGPLKNHWTLAFNSQSSQQSDYRVISYAPEAMTIVAYTGCPVEVNGKRVPYPGEVYPECEHAETAQLIYPEEKMHFTLYRLPGKGRDLQQHPVSRSLPNDSRCTSCHGIGNETNTKFEPYNSWPGFFGSRSRDGEDVIRKGSAEHEKYVEFLDRIFQTPWDYKKYTRLNWRLKDTLKPQAITRENLEYYVNKGEIPLRIQHSGTTQPSPELNKMLSRWRGRMIIKRLAESPQYDRIKYALAATAAGCYSAFEEESPVTEYLPDALAKISYRKFADFIEKEAEKDRLKATQQVREENPFDDDGRYRLVGPNPNGERTKTEFIQLAYVWNALGYSFTTWSNAVHQKFNFNEGESAIGPIFKTFVEYTYKCDPDMQEFIESLDYERFAGVQPYKDFSIESRRKMCRRLAKLAKK